MFSYIRKGEVFLKLRETLWYFVYFSAIPESPQSKSKMGFALTKGVSFFKICNSTSNNSGNVF